jgi:DNA-nicking Smr family endonuclease
MAAAHQKRCMRRRPGSLTDQDTQTWAEYARLVRRLPGRDAPPDSRAAPAPPAASAPPPAPPARPARAAPLPHVVAGLQPAGLDNASWSRFRTGRLAPTRTLDLHGKTVHAAYQALERFLHTAHADHVRCVEIITGRGSGESGGAIRREFRLWLNLPNIRPLVLAAAHPHAHNDGATRVLLRRVGRGK